MIWSHCPAYPLRMLAFCDVAMMAMIRDHGVKQFVSRYRKVEGIENDELKWGDEVGDHHYHLLFLPFVQFDAFFHMARFARSYCLFFPHGSLGRRLSDVAS